MTDLPYRRFATYAACSVALGLICTAITYAVTAPHLRFFPVIETTTAFSIGCFVPWLCTVVWWRSKLVATGPITKTPVGVMRRAEIIVAAFGVVGFASNAWLFGATHDLLWNLAVTALIVTPGMTYGVRYALAHLDPPSPREAQRLRYNYVAMTVGSVVYALILADQFVVRLPNADEFWGRQFAVALYGVSVPVFAVNAYFIWQRYRQARALAAFAG